MGICLSPSASCLIIIYLLSTGRVSVQRISLFLSLRDARSRHFNYTNADRALTFNYHIVHINIVIDVIILERFYTKRSCISSVVLVGNFLPSLRDLLYFLFFLRSLSTSTKFVSFYVRKV